MSNKLAPVPPELLIGKYKRFYLLMQDGAWHSKNDIETLANLCDMYNDMSEMRRRGYAIKSKHRDGTVYYRMSHETIENTDSFVGTPPLPRNSVVHVRTYNALKQLAIGEFNLIRMETAEDNIKERACKALAMLGVEVGE